MLLYAALLFSFTDKKKNYFPLVVCHSLLSSLPMTSMTSSSESKQYGAIYQEAQKQNTCEVIFLKHMHPQSSSPSLSRTHLFCPHYGFTLFKLIKSPQSIQFTSQRCSLKGHYCNTELCCHKNQRPRKPLPDPKHHTAKPQNSMLMTRSHPVSTQVPSLAPRQGYLHQPFRQPKAI